MRHVCRNCHFLIKELNDGNRTYRSSLDVEERSKLLTDPSTAVPEYYSLNCYCGVWDEGEGKLDRDRAGTTNEVSRRHFCFFFSHRPGMLLGAARELQKRQDEYRQVKQSNFYTRIGLYVAAAALLLDVLIRVFQNP